MRQRLAAARLGDSLVECYLCLRPAVESSSTPAEYGRPRSVRSRIVGALRRLLDEVEGKRDQGNSMLAMVLRARARQQQKAFVLVELAPLHSGDVAFELHSHDSQ